MKNTITCPCGSNFDYMNCCKKAHDNLANVVTAEELMRSRYCAFTQANGNYLMLSHHSTTRPTKEKEEIIAWAKAVEWVNLEILSTHKGMKGDNEGTVEFKAYFKEQGELSYIYETSKFIKENNCWVYLGVV